jgi:hypothetical protein
VLAIRLRSYGLAFLLAPAIASAAGTSLLLGL